MTLTRRILESLAAIDLELLNTVLVATDCISLFSVILHKLFLQKRKDYLFTDLKKNILTMFVTFMNKSNHDIGLFFMQDDAYGLLDDILMHEEDQEVVEITLMLLGNICAENDPYFRDFILKKGTITKYVSQRVKEPFEILVWNILNLIKPVSYDYENNSGTYT